MINERDFAELLFPHVDNSLVWCRLQCVSTRFNQVGKSKLVIKALNKYNDYIIWTELPNGNLHGKYKINRKIVDRAQDQVICVLSYTSNETHRKIVESNLLFKVTPEKIIDILACRPSDR